MNEYFIKYSVVLGYPDGLTEKVEVIEAFNARKAIDILAKNKYCFELLDIKKL